MKKGLGLLLVVLVLLSGCAREEVSIDIFDLGEKILEVVPFRDELTKVDDNTAKMLYNTEDFVNACVYISSGATAEEVALFEFRDSAGAREGLALAKQRISHQREGFANYIPEEVAKLDNAYAAQLDRYVIVCVSDSEDAEKVIGDLLG